MPLKRVLSKIKEITKLPKININLDNDSPGRAMRATFNKPHVKYRIIRSKTIGVALLRSPESKEGYLRGKPKQVVRTNINKARKSGYFCAVFHALDRIDEMIAINCSSTNRQGRLMSSAYTDGASLKSYFQNSDRILGVFASDGGLVAYAQPVVSGELLLIKRILGHDAHLEHGIMYLLMYGLIEYAIEDHCSQSVHWIMYDTMYGAAPGLRYFKERLGFQPYRVKWGVAACRA